MEIRFFSFSDLPKWFRRSLKQNHVFLLPKELPQGYCLIFSLLFFIIPKSKRKDGHSYLRLLNKLQGRVKKYLTMNDFKEIFEANQSLFFGLEVIIIRAERNHVYPIARIGNCGNRLCHIVVCRAKGVHNNHPKAYHAYPVISLASFLRRTKRMTTTFLCPYCLKKFFTPLCYASHRKECERLSGRQSPFTTKLLTPKLGQNAVFFKNHNFKFKPHFSIFFDIESLLVPDGRCGLCVHHDDSNCVHSSSSNVVKQRHVLYSVAATVVDLYQDRVLDSVFFEDTRQNAMVSFLNYLLEKSSSFQAMHNAVPVLSPKEMRAARKLLGVPKECHICEKRFGDQHPFLSDQKRKLSLEEKMVDPIVLDHCHASGTVLGYRYSK